MKLLLLCHSTLYTANTYKCTSNLSIQILCGGGDDSGAGAGGDTLSHQTRFWIDTHFGGALSDSVCTQSKPQRWHVERLINNVGGRMYLKVSILRHMPLCPAKKCPVQIIYQISPSA